MRSCSRVVQERRSKTSYCNRLHPAELKQEFYPRQTEHNRPVGIIRGPGLDSKHHVAYAIAYRLRTLIVAGETRPGHPAYPHSQTSIVCDQRSTRRHERTSTANYPRFADWSHVRQHQPQPTSQKLKPATTNPASRVAGPRVEQPHRSSKLALYRPRQRLQSL